MVTFTMNGLVTPSLNSMLKKHWMLCGKNRYARAVAESIKYDNANAFNSVRAFVPFGRCEIEIIRYSPGTLDEDNLHGGVKTLIDILKPLSKTNKFGLGVIVDDNPGVIVKQSVLQVKGNARTILRIAPC